VRHRESSEHRTIAAAGEFDRTLGVGAQALEVAARERRSRIASLEALEAWMGRYEEEAGTDAGRGVDTMDTMD